MYDGAGQVRSGDITQGNTQYAQPAFIESEDERLSAELAKVSHPRSGQPLHAARLAQHVAGWDALHPFRDREGRAPLAHGKRMRTEWISGHLAQDGDH